MSATFWLQMLNAFLLGILFTLVMINAFDHVIRPRRESRVAANRAKVGEGK